MLEIDDNIKIKSGEIFGFVGLVDSGRTTMLRKIYERNSSKISYVDKLPWFQLFKVKTVLKKNYNYEYVKRLDLNVNKRINDLNYNETRKLLFLMSVFTNKEIIILDEPLLLVEDGTKKVMMEIIKELKKTILISFDKIKEAKMICNRYAIIKNFKIVEVKEVNENKDYLAISIKAKKGFIYPTDYLYANDNENNNWLNTGKLRTITPSKDDQNEFYIIDNNGSLLITSSDAEDINNRPSFYLKSDVYIVDGDGSYEHPYIINR